MRPPAGVWSAENIAIVASLADLDIEGPDLDHLAAAVRRLVSDLREQPLLDPMEAHPVITFDPRWREVPQ